MQIEKLKPDHFLIKELMASYREEWQRAQGKSYKKARRYFYISDVSQCNRKIYYFFLHPEKKRSIADKTLVLFHYGNMHHEEVQFRLKNRRIIDSSRDSEYGLDDWEIDASGRLDSFVKDNGGLSIMEIKAKNPYGYQCELPDEAEVDQLLWYVFAAKESKPLKKRNIQNYGYILYVEGWPMSDFPFGGWKIEYNPERIEAIRDRFRKLKQAIDAKKIPKRPYERDSIKCQFCVMKEFCWRGVPIAEEP